MNLVLSTEESSSLGKIAHDHFHDKYYEGHSYRKVIAGCAVLISLRIGMPIEGIISNILLPAYALILHKVQQSSCLKQCEMLNVSSRVRVL